MTVCLAAIAERSKAIVMVSDKAVTYGEKDSLAPMQYDTDVKKVRQIGNTLWYALIAGDPTFALQVIEGTEKILVNRPDLSKSVDGMMNALKAAYKKRRESLVNDLVLSPRLLTKELLVARPSELLPLDREFFVEISDEAKSLRTNSSLLVCGFDTSFQPHIFSVVSPGVVKNHDMTGFHAVGIGATMAISRLLVLESLKEDSLPLALYQAFDSKVNAEVMQGVGYNWDAEILVSGKKAVEVPGSVRNLVESVYECLPLTPLLLRKRQKERKYPKEWKSRLDTFCNRVMRGARRSSRRNV
jgi:20S proteasome alpha/beta subunit